MVYKDMEQREPVFPEYFEQALSDWSIKLEKRQKCQFIRYYELLTQWNQYMNLTAITEFEEVLKKHFLDSLSLAAFLDMGQVGNLLDVGTGAGFPGIPLKIMFPHVKLTLLDSLKKRITFLEEVTKELKLEDTDAVHGRAEDLARQDTMRASYDLCVSRAVANLSTLSEYCIPFVKRGGIFAAYKSERAMEELPSAERAVGLLGAKIEEKKDFILPFSDLKRTILLIRKIKETPPAFPRKAGLPSKEPLR